MKYTVAVERWEYGTIQNYDVYGVYRDEGLASETARVAQETFDKRAEPGVQYKVHVKPIFGTKSGRAIAAHF